LLAVRRPNFFAPSLLVDRFSLFPFLFPVRTLLVCRPLSPLWFTRRAGSLPPSDPSSSGSFSFSLCGVLSLRDFTKTGCLESSPRSAEMATHISPYQYHFCGARFSPNPFPLSPSLLVIIDLLPPVSAQAFPFGFPLHFFVLSSDSLCRSRQFKPYGFLPLSLFPQRRDEIELTWPV